MRWRLLRTASITVVALVALWAAMGGFRSGRANERGFYVDSYDVHLRAVNSALREFAQSHGGQMPATLGELVDGGYLIVFEPVKDGAREKFDHRIAHVPSAIFRELEYFGGQQASPSTAPVGVVKLKVPPARVLPSGATLTLRSDGLIDIAEGQDQ